MYEALLALIPGIAAAVFGWLWRRDKKLVQLAETRLAMAEKERALAARLATDLRTVLAQRNRELKDCREKLPPASSLDDFFSGLPKRDPGRDDS